MCHCHAYSTCTPGLPLVPAHHETVHAQWFISICYNDNHSTIHAVPSSQVGARSLPESLAGTSSWKTGSAGHLHGYSNLPVSTNLEVPSIIRCIIKYLNTDYRSYKSPLVTPAWHP